MFQNLNVLAHLLRSIELGDGLAGFVSLLELYKSISSAGTIGINLELAGDNPAVRLEKVVKLALHHFLGQVLDENVGFRIELRIFLLVEDELLTVKSRVVLFIDAPHSLFLSEEIKITKAPASLGSMVEHDLGVLELVALGSKVFE